VILLGKLKEVEAFEAVKTDVLKVLD